MSPVSVGAFALLARTCSGGLKSILDTVTVLLRPKDPLSLCAGSVTEDESSDSRVEADTMLVVLLPFSKSVEAGAGLF